PSGAGRFSRPAPMRGFSGWRTCGGRGRSCCSAARTSSPASSSSSCASRAGWRACRTTSSAPAPPATTTPPRPRTPATSSSGRPSCAASSSSTMAEPEPLASRVAAYIAEHALLEPGEPVLALVSGGADSACAWGVVRELGYDVEALHVEHGLRGAEGLEDAAHCAGLGATVVAVDVEVGPNLEARARQARYAAAREHAAGRPIVTGHTLSDQAETVLYRLVSSSGARAIRAMRPAAGGIVRPLLCATAT